MPSLRSAAHVLLASSLLLAVVACEKKSRTRNSGGTGSLAEGDEAQAVPVYTFVSTEQTLGDARRAAAAEKWAEAGAAADALLKEAPTHAEAKLISEQAKLEAPNQQSYQAFAKAAAANDTIGMAKAWRNISDASLYKEKARPAFDKAKTSFVTAQENDARNMVRLGRCDEARRVVRITAEYFPDVKARFDDIPTGCRPARDDKTDRTEVATIDKRSDDRGDTTPLAAGSAAAPQRAPEPTPVAAQIKPPDAARPAATGPSAPGLAPAAAPVAPPPIPAASVRKVPPAELEGLRVAGVRTPPLPGNIKQIARRDGVKRILLAAEVCVGTDGHVTSARLVKASEYDEANESVLSAIRDWRFRPYLVEGVPSPICSGVVLPYAVEG